MNSTHVAEETVAYYQQNHAHLRDELTKLDLLIQLRVLEFRMHIQERQDPANTSAAYISHERVDWLLNGANATPTDHPDTTPIRERFRRCQDDINSKVSQSLEHGVVLALIQLGRCFGLTPFELQAVMVCLAPELDRKYDQLYAYLQDDITRKKPSVDLVLALLCETPDEKWTARTVFAGHAPLFHHGLIHMTEDLHSPSGSSDLARFLKLDPRIANFVLSNTHIDKRLQGLATVYRPTPTMDQVLVDPQVKSELLHFTQHQLSKTSADRKKLLFYFHGPYGTEKHELARGLCGAIDCSMLSLDMELLQIHETDAETLLRLAFRESVLLQATVYLDKIDVLVRDDDKAKATLKKVANMIHEYGWCVFLAGEKPWAPQGLFEQAIFHAVDLPIPDVPVRVTAWEAALQRFEPHVETSWAQHLSQQFRLTPGQIRDAAEWVAHQQAMKDDPDPVTVTDFSMACRRQSQQKLGDLAVKVEPHYSWDDLILPADKVIQLKEICLQVTHRHRVFGEWGFDRKFAHGKGLNVLFTGGPGTGKTMAAEIIAHELQLDLYKIDLSGVVSKYIGETEKNLARIFQEAETSNAILFFDEADALFGKRTEVSDAHDRYANIETSYLLQKMEMYEGIVILASNLRENMDVAFTRRIRCIVEFPFPDVASRKEIWKTNFPRQAPMSDGIDYELLAKQFQIAGGNIKNIVLNAAFLAAENGNVIGMDHLVQGTKREFEKIGKRWDDKNVIGLQ